MSHHYHRFWGIPFLIFFLLISFLPSQAQETATQLAPIQETDTTEQDEGPRKRRYVEHFHVWFRTFDETYQGMKGTPLVTEEFVEGAVITSRFARKEFDLINYEVYQDEVVVLNAAGKIEFLPKGFVRSFSLYNVNGQDSLMFGKFKDPEDQKIFFAQVLCKGKHTYIKRYEKYIQDANYQGAYNAGIPYDEFKDRVHYFAVGRKGEMIPFKRSKKGLEKLFPDKKAEIKAFMREQIPNLKSDNDLVVALSTLSSS